MSLFREILSYVTSWQISVSRAFFITQLRTLFESTLLGDDLELKIETFLSTISQFLDLLLGIRNLPEGEEFVDDRVVGTLK